MSKRTPCLGNCGRTIGTGCGCCSDEFPEQYGYCSECYEKSPAYLENIQPLRGLMDYLDAGGLQALTLFLNASDYDHEFLYRNEIQSRLEAIDVDRST